MASPGGQLTGNPAVAPSSDGRLEVFIRHRDDNALATSHQQTWGGWSDWEKLGSGTLAGGPSALRTAARRIKVFSRNDQGHLKHPWQTVINGTYGPGKTLVTHIAGNPVPGLNTDGRPEAFFRGTDGTLWHVWETAKSGYVGWTDPGNLDGSRSACGVYLSAEAVGRAIRLGLPGWGLPGKWSRGDGRVYGARGSNVPRQRPSCTY